MPVLLETAQEGSDFLSRFKAVDAEIYRTVFAQYKLEDRRERCRSGRVYNVLTRQLWDLQDQHTAAWQARHQICREYDDYYRRTYGVENKR